ncbi:hypothetical protein [Alloscardovia macacae]|nr:hypothetical protein [Alloscardovia macacae]
MTKETRYNAETEAALEEAREIMRGERDVTRYQSVEDAFADALSDVNEM